MEVDSELTTPQRKLDLVQAASFFGMDLLTFHKKHHFFFNFFSNDGVIEMIYLKKHLLETSSTIALQFEPDYQVCHPDRCCQSGEDFCRSTSLSRILLEGIRYANDKGMKAPESFLWHLVLTSERKCCLRNLLTFEYTLFTLVEAETIKFEKSEDGTRDYEIVPPKSKKAGRPRKYL